MANPTTPGNVIWIGVDGGPFTVVSASNPLPITVVNNYVSMVGVVGEGVAAANNPVRCAGWDGANLRTIKTDASGVVSVAVTSTTGSGTVVGTTAIAAAVSGNPVLVGVSDGTNARYLLGDTSGRPIIVGAAAAGAAVAGNPILIGAHDGTNAQYLKTASAANVSASPIAGAALVANPGEWAQAHTPGTATQATTTKAAGGAGVRHVCRSIAFSLITAGTAQATPIQVNLRDGATGAGTILWSMTIALNATNDKFAFAVSGLNIFGTANTAMTLEFSAAGAAATSESVSISGYDVT